MCDTEFEILVVSSFILHSNGKFSRFFTHLDLGEIDQFGHIVIGVSGERKRNQERLQREAKVEKGKLTLKIHFKNSSGPPKV